MKGGVICYLLSIIPEERTLRCRKFPFRRFVASVATYYKPKSKMSNIGKVNSTGSFLSDPNR